MTRDRHDVHDAVAKIVLGDLARPVPEGEELDERVGAGSDHPGARHSTQVRVTGGVVAVAM